MQISIFPSSGSVHLAYMQISIFPSPGNMYMQISIPKAEFRRTSVASRLREQFLLA